MKTTMERVAFQLPAVLDLRSKVEAFLYNVKLVLREIAGLFEPFYSQKFDHKYQKITKWSENHFGVTDDLTELLISDSAWIEQVIAMRNAVDHPGSGDGTLFVENFKLVMSTAPIQVQEPTWFRYNEAPRLIAPEMDIIMNNLLTLYEDLLSISLLKNRPSGPVVITEIPEAERVQAVPVRLKISLRNPI